VTFASIASPVRAGDVVIASETGEATATTGINCGLSGSQNSIVFVASTRKSM
jgi:hypothetical protein